MRGHGNDGPAELGRVFAVCSYADMIVSFRMIQNDTRTQ